MGFELWHTAPWLDVVSDATAVCHIVVISSSISTVRCGHAHDSIHQYESCEKHWSFEWSLQYLLLERKGISKHTWMWTECLYFFLWNYRNKSTSAHMIITADCWVILDCTCTFCTFRNLMLPKVSMWASTHIDRRVGAPRELGLYISAATMFWVALLWKAPRPESGVFKIYF